MFKIRRFYQKEPLKLLIRNYVKERLKLSLGQFFCRYGDPITYIKSRFPEWFAIWTVLVRDYLENTK